MAALAGALACNPRPSERAAASAEPRLRALPSATVPPQPLTAPAQKLQPALLEAPVHRPADARPGEKLPLLVLLHGFGGSSAQIEQHTEFPAFAARRRIAWIAPDGALDRSGRRFWNAGPSCCNFDPLEIDHVAALRALIERAIARDGIDPARVFVVGFSNGGFMAHRLGCELRSLVRGIVSVAGAGPRTPVTCASGGPLRVLEIHGDADRVVSYAGGHLFGNAAYPEHISAERTIRDWASVLGCATSPRPGPALDFEATIPGKETSVSRFDGCRDGQVELWTVAAGTHFVSFRSPAPEAIWEFLSR